jgi:hypothetical protein
LQVDELFAPMSTRRGVPDEAKSLEGDATGRTNLSEKITPYRERIREIARAALYQVFLLFTIGFSLFDLNVGLLLALSRLTIDHESDLRTPATSKVDLAPKPPLKISPRQMFHNPVRPGHSICSLQSCLTTRRTLSFWISSVNTIRKLL